MHLFCYSSSHDCIMLFVYLMFHWSANGWVWLALKSQQAQQGRNLASLHCIITWFTSSCTYIQLFCEEKLNIAVCILDSTYVCIIIARKYVDIIYGLAHAWRSSPYSLSQVTREPGKEVNCLVHKNVCHGTLHAGCGGASCGDVNTKSVFGTRRLAVTAYSDMDCMHSSNIIMIQHTLIL